MRGKPNRKSFLLSLVLVFVLAGCATVIRGTQDVIYVNSLETGTRISVDDTPRGKDTAMAQVKRGQPHTIRASKPGCEDVTTRTGDAFDAFSLWGILFDFGIISIPTDLISGAAWKTDPTIYTVTPICPGSAEAERRPAPPPAVGTTGI
jgi:hypothetical protein